MKYLIIIAILSSLIFSSCIGDKVVRVPYFVINNSDQVLYVEGETSLSRIFNPDTLYKVAPKEKRVIRVSQKICGFGNCRITIKNEGFIEELKVYKDSFKKNLIHSENLEWKVKKRKAILRIN